MARIGLSKQIILALEKIKTDPKIDGWKRTFIQYKARCEKRKNWKEKNRLLKEIETKLKQEKTEDKEESNESDNENDKMKVENAQPENEIKKPQSKIKAKEPEEKNKIKNEVKKEKTKHKEPVKRKVKFSDDESDEEEEEEENESSEEIGLDEEDLNGYDSHDDDKWNEQAKASEEEEESESSEDEEDTSQVYVYSKANLINEDKKEESKQTLKPLVIGNKPSHMEIKQINLDEIKDLGEIPIDNKETCSEASDSEAKVETIKAVEDPFFLDKDGNEIQTTEDTRFRSYRRDEEFFQDELRSYSSYDKYKNREDFRNRRNDLTRSSFKNSLSSSGFSRDRKPYDRNDGGNFRRDFQGRNNDRGFSRDNQRNGGFRDNQAGRNFKDNNRFSNSDRFSNKRTFENKSNVFNKPKETMDVSKLHPSWQAKKLAEEKAKSLKFEGKKIKFDED